MPHRHALDTAPSIRAGRQFASVGAAPHSNSELPRDAPPSRTLLPLRHRYLSGGWSVSLGIRSPIQYRHSQSRTYRVAVVREWFYRSARCCENLVLMQNKQGATKIIYLLREETDCPCTPLQGVLQESGHQPGR